MNVVQVSSGVASAFTWYKALLRDPNAIGLFADVNGEDVDNYRFLDEVHAHLGGQLVRLDNDGRTIWDVFRKRRFLGNSMVAPCTAELKREACIAWMQDHTPGAVVWFGFDWTEPHRMYEERINPKTGEPEVRGMRPLYEPHGFTCYAPMIDDVLDKAEALAWLASVGIEPPRLTRMGYPHANCKGFCIKAGHGQARKLLRELPENFDWWERNEHETRVFLGKDVSILRDRTGGTSTPYTLTQIREEECAKPTQLDLLHDEQESCSCFTPEWMTRP